MGTWGMGPFDSDSALDLLGDLTPDTATRTVAEALAAVVRAPQPGEYRRGALDDAYACAGLVAARLVPHAAAGSTNLLAVLAGDDSGLNVGLGNHLGYADNLSAEDARAQRDAALQALAALREETDWVQAWSGDITAVLDELETLLRAA